MLREASMAFRRRRGTKSKSPIVILSRPAAIGLGSLVGPSTGGEVDTLTFVAVE